MKQESQDDTLLRSYLLGKLRDEEVDRLEQRLLQEDELFELAEAVEADLLAAADRGDLAPAERERVLRRLASSPQGRERLALARSLNAIAGERAPGVVAFPRRVPVFPSSTIHWVALAASLLVLTGLGWFAWQNRSQAPAAASRVAVQTPTPAPPKLPAPEAMTPAPGLAAPAIEKTPKTAPERVGPRPKPRPALTPPDVLALTLMGSRGDEEVAKLRLSPGNPRAEIQIDTEDVDARSFDVAIRNREKETIWEKNGLEPIPVQGSQVLVIDIPAKRLTAGRYEVAVTPQGAEEISLEFEVEEATR